VQHAAFNIDVIEGQAPDSRNAVAVPVAEEQQGLNLAKAEKTAR